jgi:NAD(P)-dependent dehydrogenase (short-subunit alcohol dehydrogenase family)
MSRSFALVTGASGGIGLELAHELQSRGYDLAICSAGEDCKARPKVILSSIGGVIHWAAPWRS